MFAIALLFRPNPRTSVAQTVYVEFFPPFESTTRNYIPLLLPEEFDIPLPEPSVLSRLTKALEFRRKGIPVVIRRKSEGNGRVEEAGGAAWICGGLSREADRNPFPGREGSTGAVSTMPQSGLTSRDRSRVRRSRTVRAETIVPLISPVSFVCIVPLHRLSSLLSLFLSRRTTKGNIARCTLKLDRFHHESGERGREGGKQDQEERASRSRLNVASPGL